MRDDFKNRLLPREKAIANGIESLQDFELIAALISTGTKEKSVFDLSKLIISKIRNIKDEDKFLTYIDLAGISGLGQAKSITVLAAIELGRRLFKISNLTGKVVISSTDKAFEILKPMVNKKQEYLIALFLDARYQLIRKRTIYIGNSNRVFVQPKDILIPALELNSTFLIIAHNHPSGNCEPSFEDIAVTRRIKDACTLVGIEFLEHIVIGNQGYKVIDSV
jgi:DNA repair protein RadC